MSEARSSGVRNLRAMFEGQGREESSRSQSPAGSVDSSRRTSRVRSSFVTVEPSGQAVQGTARNVSGGESSAASQRRESFSLSPEDDAEKIAELKRTVSEEAERRKSLGVKELIPEAVIESVGGTPYLEKSEGEAMLGSKNAKSFAARVAEASAKKGLPKKELPENREPYRNPDKRISAEEEDAKMGISDPKDAKAVSAVDASPKKSTTTKTSTISTKPSVKETSKKPGVTASSTTTAATKTRPAKPTLDKVSTSNPKSPAKSPATSKAPSSSVASPRSSGGVPSFMKPTTSRVSHTDGSNTKPRVSSVGSTTSTSSKASKPGIRSETGFVKPAPRSPTRPVKLPSHLVQPTASSAAKHDKTDVKRTAPSSSTTRLRPSGSRASLSATPSTSATVSKKTSRASLAGTHKPELASHAAARTEKKSPDDGFLARMMRPTASSSSKLHDNDSDAVPAPTRATPPAATKKPTTSTKPRTSTSATTSSKVKKEDMPAPVKTAPASATAATVAAPEVAKEHLEKVDPSTKKAPEQASKRIEPHQEPVSEPKIESAAESSTNVVGESHNATLDEPASLTQSSSTEPVAEEHSQHSLVADAAEPEPVPTSAETEPPVAAQAPQQPEDIAALSIVDISSDGPSPNTNDVAPVAAEIAVATKETAPLEPPSKPLAETTQELVAEEKKEEAPSTLVDLSESAKPTVAEEPLAKALSEATQEVAAQKTIEKDESRMTPEHTSRPVEENLLDATPAFGGETIR